MPDLDVPRDIPRDVPVDMPDVPRPPFPLVLPKPFGFEDAVRRGRSIRRHRTAGAGAGLMTLLVGVVGAAVIMNSPTGGQQINTTNPTKERREQPSEHRDRVRLPTQTPSSAGTPSSTDGSGPRASDRRPGVVFHDQEDPAPGKVTTPQKPQVPSPRRKPRMTDGPASTPNPCPPLINPPEQGWCMTVEAAPSGTKMLLEFQVCRDLGSENRQGSLTFRSAQEADLRVTDSSGNDVWQWSRGQRFGPGRDDSIILQAGECHAWRVEWDRTDESGNALDSGPYRLTGWSTADNFVGRAPAEYTFDI